MSLLTFFFFWKKLLISLCSYFSLSKIQYQRTSPLSSKVLQVPHPLCPRSLSLMTLFVVFIPRFLTISLSSYLISDIPNFFEHIDKMGLTVSRRRLEQLERRGSQRPWIDLLAWEHDLALGAFDLKVLVEYRSLIGRKGNRRKRRGSGRGCGALCTHRWKKRGREAC